MRITLLSILLLLFTGCADDLVGPDAASDGPPSTSQTARSASRPFAPDAEGPSIAGTWQASDPSGSITLYIGGTGFSPDMSLTAARSIEGKGVVRGPGDAPLFVGVEGTYRLRDIAFTLGDTRGTVAKAEGTISRDFTSIKVLLRDSSDRERTLLFKRL